MWSLSYREKALYASLAVELLVFVPYFTREALHPGRSLAPLFGRVMVFLVGVVAMEVLVAVSTRHRQVDERDRVINARSCKLAYVALIVCVSAMIGVLGSQEMVRTTVVINDLMASVFVAYAVQVVVQLVMYRRTM
jgi:hypothetical protein